MNHVTLIGRITKDLELNYRGTQNTAMVQFTLAINGPDRTDFPRIKAWGKTAENLNKYCGKGSMVAVEGKIQTGSYEKDGQTIYTTDIIADRVEFLSWEKKDNEEVDY